MLKNSINTAFEGAPLTKKHPYKTIINPVNWRGFFLYFLRQQRRLRVINDSMLPTLSSGEEILYNPQAYNKTSPQVGEIVVAKHPCKPNLLIIKRIAEVDTHGWIFLLSDNKNVGTDSRTLGKISPQMISGKVTFRFS